MAIGGMPEAVNRWRETQDLHSVQQVHRQLLNAFIQDFEKYAKNTQLKYVDLLFKRIPQQLGRRFVYQQVGQHYRKRELSPCFDLLEKAGIVHRVYATSGQGVPLGAHASLEIFKPLFLDVALAQTLVDLSLKDWFLEPTLAVVNKGAVVEAMVGVELLALSPPEFKQSLYYWHRMEPSSNAEIDYLFQQHQEVLPIEVKSGATGHLKSMHYFLGKYPETPYGLRFSSDQYSVYEKIITYPIYALSAAFEAMQARVKAFINSVEQPSSK